MERTLTHSHHKAHALLWTLQVLLALVFLFAGGTKLALPIEMMKLPVPLPGLFLRFIGLCEVLGALGLILPGWLNIRTSLTPLAALGLFIIMIGATTITMMGGQFTAALFPATVGVLTAGVGVGRWRVVPFVPLLVAERRITSMPMPR
jgi:uncharacterized membrane protein YphA (DoxX/SURF4 family)